MINPHLTVSEYVTGANGDLSRPEIIERVAESLADWVYEMTIEGGLFTREHVQGFLASAVVRQCEFDRGIHLRSEWTEAMVPPAS